MFVTTGWAHKAVKMLRDLTNRYRDDVRLWNLYGVTNLIVNRIEDAREAFRKVCIAINR